MNARRRILLALLVLVVGVVAVLAVVGCSFSTHPVVPSALGSPTSSDAMVRAPDEGPRIRMTRVDSARWQVDLSGLLHLDHPRAVEADLEDRLEDIVISFWVLEHPSRGTYLVDTGVASSFRDPDSAPVSALVGSVMGLERLEVQTDLATWLASHGPISGVFLTHLHLDHVMGLPDVPADVPVYAGPGETEARAFLYMFLQGSIDQLLQGRGAIAEWGYRGDAASRFAGVVDVFGDGSLFAVHVPGHTPGSTAYFVRSTEGPKLLVGDASHTSWGWNHCVEPGTYNHDLEGAAVSLHRLKAFAAEVAGLGIEPGHQHHEPQAEAVACSE